MSQAHHFSDVEGNELQHYNENQEQNQDDDETGDEGFKIEKKKRKRREKSETIEDEKEEVGVTTGLTVYDTSVLANLGNQDFGPWGDAETKAFYEDLPDLLSSVPNTALGLSVEQVWECTSFCFVGESVIILFLLKQILLIWRVMYYLGGSIERGMEIG